MNGFVKNHSITMKNKKHSIVGNCTLTLLCAALINHSAEAASGTWNLDGNSVWNVATDPPWAGAIIADGTGDTGGCTAASAGLADCSPAAVAPAARAALATAGGTTVTQSPEAGGPCGTSAGGGAEDTHWLGCGGAAACICGASPHDCGSVGGVGRPAGGTTGVPARARESGGN